MYVEQLYTGCLAEAAYYIESNGEAAIIDPLRETFPYTDLAEKRGAKSNTFLKHIFMPILYQVTLIWLKKQEQL
jgi:hydroxyacylglutathione hydrolase